VNRTGKNTIFEIAFYIGLAIFLLATGVVTLGGIGGFIGAVLMFLGVIFLLKMWQDGKK
jgi:hypothetical protein